MKQNVSITENVDGNGSSLSEIEARKKYKKFRDWILEKNLYYASLISWIDR